MKIRIFPGCVLVAFTAFVSVAWLGFGGAESSVEEGRKILARDGVAGVAKAVGLFDKAIRKDPALDAAYLEAGQACLLKFELEKRKDPSWLERAGKYADALLARKPRQTDAMALRSQVLLDLGRERDAMGLLSKALKGDPGHPAANLTALGVLIRSGKKDTIAAFCREAAPAAATNTVLVRAMGDLLINNGYATHALILFREALAKGGDRSLPLLIMTAATFGEVKEYRQAIPLLRKALDLDPNQPGPLSGLSGCFEALGDTDQAIRYAEQYSAKVPDDSAARLRLANLYDKAGRAQEAAALRSELKSGEKKKP